MFQHILAPVDFSPLSALGLRYAAALANCAGARVTALYADLFEPPPYFTESDVDRLQQQIETARRQAETHLRKFVDATVPGGVAIAVRVEEGLPADAIRSAAANADLVVMGTHGRRGMNRLLLGSVTERVLRETKIPVLAVRGDWNGGEIRRIVCPVNNSDAARRALATASQLARCMGSAISVLHVPEPGADGAIEDLCAWIPEAERGICSVAEIKAGGDVAAEVIRTASQLNADLLVLGARHRRFFDATILGANTIRVMRHAPCPVLAVFGEPERE